MNHEKASPLDLEFAALLPTPTPTPECIVFALSLEQMNALMAVLGASPYSLVADLIDTIRLQAADQWNDQAQAQALAAAPAASDATN